MYCIGHVPDVYSIGVSVWKSSKSNDRVGVLKYIPCSRLKVRHNFCFYYILNSNKRRFIDWVLEVIRERILIGMRYMRMVSNSKESRKLYYLVVMYLFRHMFKSFGSVYTLIYESIGTFIFAVCKKWNISIVFKYWIFESS